MGSLLLSAGGRRDYVTAPWRRDGEWVNEKEDYVSDYFLVGTGQSLFVSGAMGFLLCAKRSKLLQLHIKHTGMRHAIFPFNEPEV